MRRSLASWRSLGDGLDVPVCVVDVDVPEVGRELRDLPFDIQPPPVPLDQRADGESMPQVMNPRPVTVPVSASRCSKADLLTLAKWYRVLHCVIRRPCSETKKAGVARRRRIRSLCAA